MVTSSSSDPRLSTPAKTLLDGEVPRAHSLRHSAAKRYLLLVLFCLAQFIDTFNNAALFTAIPTLVIYLKMSQSNATWIISAFQLTFASFLLISGRISDVYNPKYAFICGIMVLGIISIGAGFVSDKITLIVLRALGGIAASLTIPSALTLLVDVFPEEKEQARAIGVFGGCGSVGNIFGLIIGAIFVEFTSWSWVFWFVALVAIPIGILCMFLVPNSRRDCGTDKMGKARWKSLDLVGVSILTAALILFIFAVTSGSSSGWGSAAVIAPLVISVTMISGFFYYETLIPADTAAVPPRTWFLPNFAVLFGMALLPYFWWTTIFVVITNLWQEIYHWSIISVALRMIPLGVFGFAVSFSGPLSSMFSPKYVLLAGQGLLVVATILLALADSPDKYFSYVLPAFILGTSGGMFTFTHTNIAIFRTSPASMAGTVGAIFNGALQLGSAVGIAAVSSIATSIEAEIGDSSSYKGRAAAFWFLLGIIGLEIISMLVFYRVEAEHRSLHAGAEQGVGEDGNKKSKAQNTVETDNSAVGPTHEDERMVEKITREEVVRIH